MTLLGEPDYSISCTHKEITTTAALTCTIQCQAEATNLWLEEIGLRCENPDSNCTFSNGGEVSFGTGDLQPFTVDINHAGVTGTHLNEIVGDVGTQAGVIERAEVITINQLDVADYIFTDSFDGIICQ